MLKSSFAILVAMSAFVPLAAASTQTPEPAPIMEGDTHKDHDKAKCPVTGKTIPEGKGVKVTVRGHEYSVIDQAAADKLTANPDKFLKADGTPKKGEKHEKSENKAPKMQ